jgi:hypothetical protein
MGMGSRAEAAWAEGKHSLFRLKFSEIYFFLFFI